MVLRSRMSGISSLGLDRKYFALFHAGEKVLSQVLLVAPSRVVIPTAPCCTKKLLCKKYVLLKKTSSQKAHHRFLYTNYECTTAVPLYCWCMACTYCQQFCDTSVHLLYHHCCMYTYRCKCITSTKLSPSWPVRTANITTMGMIFWTCEGSSEYHGSGDGLHERPLVGRVVAWPRVPHIRGQLQSHGAS